MSFAISDALGASMRALLVTVVLAVIATPFAVAAADEVATDAPAPTTSTTTKAPPAPTTTTGAPTTTTTPGVPKPAVDEPNPSPAPGITDDSDADGVATAIEDSAPNGGDANDDGILDSQQSNVASLPAAVDVDDNGLLDDIVTLVAPVGTSLEHVTARTVPPSPAPPADAFFPYGLFDYDLRVANVGDTADVTYILPDGPAPESFYVLQNDKWSNVTDHVSIDEAKNEVTFGLRDGGLGDATTVADGVIRDPSGPASQTVGALTANGTLTINKAGDRTGGGAISGAAGAVFSLYTDSNLTIPASPATCGPTNASGACTVQLAPGTYFAKETTAPPGYLALPQLATDQSGTGAGTNRDYTNKIGPLTVTSGSTLTVPNNSGLSHDDYNYNSGRFANSRVNPLLPSVCGLNVAMILDLSGSIDNTEFGQMKTAAKGFVTSLTLTPSSVGIYSFATNAPAAGNTNLASTSVSSAAGGTTVKNKIDALVKPTGSAFYTNWDAAFRSIPSGYDLVMILSDGNPTVDGTGNIDTSTVTTNFLRVEAGIASANTVKTLGNTHGGNTRVIGIGIGIGGNSQKNLAAVSGPTAYNGANAAAADYFTTGFDTLGETLAQIAKSQCAGSVTATKQTRTGPGASDWALTSGWQFGITPAASASNPANGQTDANGAVSFSFSAGPWPKTVQVFETQQSGFSLTQQSGLNAACTVNGASFPPGAVSNVNVPDAPHPGVQFQLNQLDTASCNFRNSPTPGSITIKKQTNGGVGGPFKFTLTGPNGTNASYDNVNTTAGSNPTTAGTANNLYPGTYVATETSSPAGWTLESISCPGAVVDIANKKATITMPPTGVAVTCTFVNAQDIGSLLVQKQTIGDVGSFDFTLSGQSGKSVTTTQQNVFTSPASGAWANLTPGNFTIDESNAGASWITSNFTCKVGATTVASGPGALSVPVGAGQGVVCKITNTKKGSLLVQKETVGGLGTFDFTLSGQSGKSVTTTQQNVFTSPASGVWANLTPGDFMLDEANPDGSWIEGDFTCQVGNITVASGPGTLSVPVGAGESVVCQVTNTKKGSITVEKRTVGDVGSFDFTLTGEPARSVTTTQQNTFTAANPWTNLASGSYTIDEIDPGAAWVAGTFGCNYVGSQEPPLTGASPTIDLTSGQAWTCQITNSKEGTITVEKRTVGDVGSFDFTLTGLSGRTVLTTEENTFTAGTPWSNLIVGSYTIDEVDPGTGWVAGPFSCNYAGSQVPPLTGASPTIDLTSGQAWTCQVTNTKKGSLLVQKQTIGDVGSFDFTLSGQSGKSVTTTQQNVFASPASGAWVELTPGDFTLDAANPDSSWIEGNVVCKVGDTTVASGAGPLSVPVGAGQSVVCRVTNTKKGSITVEKRTVGDVGSFDFTLTGQSGRTVVTTEENTFTAGTPWSNLTAGSYTIDEVDPGAAWIAGTFSCNYMGSQVAPITGASPTIDVTAGQAWTCQVTNTKKGSLLVEKQTIGDVGSFDFTLSGQSGKSVTTTQQNVFASPASGAWANLTPGDFMLDEANPDSSWIEGNFVCKVGDTTVASGAGPLSVPVGAGHGVVCQTTNTKNGSITITKVAVPQDAQAFRFTTTNLGGPFSLTGNTGLSQSTKAFSNLVTGTTYTVTEDAVTGWKLTGLDCTGLGAGDSSNVATGVVSVLMKPGQAVECTYTNTSPDLSVTKSDTPDPVAAGAQLTYTVTATNHGPANATDVVVTDKLDANTNFVSTSLGAACAHAAGAVTCELGAMVNGAVIEFTITVTVHAVAPDGTNVLENVVDIQGDQPDWNPSNNHDEEPTSVIRVVDLTLVKTDNGAQPVAGGAPFGYTLTIDNAGPSDASVAATVTDVLPAGFVLAAAAPTINPAAGNSCVGAVGDSTFTCTIKVSDLHVTEDPVVVTLSVRVLATVTPGTYINKAIVTSPDDPTPQCTLSLQGIDCGENPPNNYDEEPTPVTSDVDLEILKTAGEAAVSAGRPFTYTLSVNNRGPSDAQDDATVIDVLPADVTFVAFATLLAGVTCGQPVGRTITCQIVKGLLRVADPRVSITMDVVVPARPTSLPLTNEVIVTSPDDEALCVVTLTNITCDPSDTNNYDDVVVGFVESAVVTPPSPSPLAFTGSYAGRLILMGILLVNLGAALVLIMDMHRRRRDEAMIAARARID